MEGSNEEPEPCAPLRCPQAFGKIGVFQFASNPTLFGTNDLTLTSYARVASPLSRRVAHHFLTFDIG